LERGARVVLADIDEEVAAAYVNGAELTADGGMTAGVPFPTR
jgi:hypothetical protein